jgi:hypothetical protein
MPKLERRKENGLESNWQLAPSDRGCNSLERGGKLAAAQAYQQINLVSDIQGLASNPPNGQADTQLLNPWGIVASPTSPWWVSDNNAGVSSFTTARESSKGSS